MKNTFFIISTILVASLTIACNRGKLEQSQEVVFDSIPSIIEEDIEVFSNEDNNPIFDTI